MKIAWISSVTVRPTAPAGAPGVLLLNWYVPVGVAANSSVPSTLVLNVESEYHCLKLVALWITVTVVSTRRRWSPGPVTQQSPTFGIEAEGVQTAVPVAGQVPS